MTTDDIVRRLEPWRAKHRRPAWDPVVTPGDDPAVSKFGGTAWTGAGLLAPWPRCGHCGKRMPLFVQLDLAALPVELGGRFGGGLLQLFYCTGDDCFDGHEPFGLESCVRVVRPVGTPAAMPPGVDGFPGSVIIGWERFDDLPDEADRDGVRCEYDSLNRSLRVVCPELGVDADGVSRETRDAALGDADGRDKLAGWPAWVQWREYPNCPRCKRRMELLFQLASEDNVPFMFGDCGVGHVTQCPEHKDEVAFGWACC